MTNLRGDNNVFVLAREGETLRLTAYLEQEQILFKFHVGKTKLFQPFYSEAIRTAYREILAAFSIDMVHVHHIMGLSFDIFETAKEMGIPLVLSMHDFYYVCPTLKLMENGTRYCAGFGENCVECLRTQLGYTDQVVYLGAWREKCRQAMGLCDALIAPSNAVKEIYTAVYPDLGERIRVIPHGMDPFEEKKIELRKDSGSGFSCFIEHAFEQGYTISGWALQEGCISSESDVFICVEDIEGTRGEYQAMREDRPDVVQARGDNRYMGCGFSVQLPDCWFATGELKIQLVVENRGMRFHSDVMPVKGYTRREKTRRRIAFLGGLNEFKGSQAACQMIRHSGNQYDWYVIGGIGDPELSTLERSNVHKLGWYKRENVGAILGQNQIDLVCILPTCPETFCYTLSEAELAGVPVLASDIGALRERLERDQTGWLIPAGVSGKEVLKKLEAIFADQQEFDRVRQNAARFRHRTIGEMCGDYVRVYEDIPAGMKQWREFDAQGIYHAYVMGQAQHSGYGGAADMDLVRRVGELEATLQNIDQSLEYKMVKFFNRESFPFKRQFRWLIRVAYKIYKRLKR